MLIRRWIVAGIIIVSACEPGVSPAARRGLERGRQAAGRWLGETAAPIVPAATAISLGYLERLRLGLGSPFRLADQALEDARLVESERRDVAWAILARTLDRQNYEIEPAALDGITRPGGARDAGHAGFRHAELIELTIRESRDPRAGELAIRLAYADAIADGELQPDALRTVAGFAALARDRELARADVLTLFRAASEERIDPLELLEAWRAQRRFQVEAPILLPVSETAQREAVASVPGLGRRLRHILRDAGSDRTADTRYTPVLDSNAAWSLAAISGAAELPPQPPVALAVASGRSDLADALGDDPAARAAGEQFANEAVTEEAFAAAFRLLPKVAPVTTASARIALAAAVAMRSFAQEPARLQPSDATTAEELETRHGLADLQFTDDVPESWRAANLRAIDLALSDLRRILPDLDLSGLSVRITRAPGVGGTLALHDPRRRRLILPAATAAGTLAHEIAHDLDWQVALERFDVRGDYGSDVASRMAGRPLAAAFSDFRIASDGSTGGPDVTAHSRRPAEVFARALDWLVAVSLAATGRSNGYLTSIQDDVLTGYGSARPPDVTGSAEHALVRVLDEIAPIDPPARAHFLARYGRTRPLTAWDRARQRLEANATATAMAEDSSTAPARE